MWTKTTVSRGFVLWAGLCLAACGGASEAGSGPAGPGGDTAGAPHVAGKGGGTGRGGRKHEHRGFTPELTAYHDVMSPLWHAQPGEQRTADTCAQAGELVARAQAIASAPAPEAAAGGDWQGRANALVAASESLQATCSGDRSGFNGQFQAVHDSFHQLMRLLDS